MDNKQLEADIQQQEVILEDVNHAIKHYYDRGINDAKYISGLEARREVLIKRLAELRKSTEKCTEALKNVGTTVEKLEKPLVAFATVVHRDSVISSIMVSIEADKATISDMESQLERLEKLGDKAPRGLEDAMRERISKLYKNIEENYERIGALDKEWRTLHPIRYWLSIVDKFIDKLLRRHDRRA